MQRRSIFIFSHSLQVHRIYLSIFFLSFFFFPKNQEFSIIEWNNCSGENSLQAPKVKEKSSVKNTRLFLKPTSSFAFKCCSEAVVLINLVGAGSFVGYMDFLCSMSQYIFLWLLNRWTTRKLRHCYLGIPCNKNSSPSVWRWHLRLKRQYKCLKINLPNGSVNLPKTLRGLTDNSMNFLLKCAFVRTKG